MDEGQEREKKFGLVEVIFVSIAFIGVGLLAGVPWVGPLVDFLAIQAYLAMKGVSGTQQLIMLCSNVIVEFMSTIPLIGGWAAELLPLAVLWIIVGIDWFAPEKVKEEVEKVGAVVNKAEGGVGGAAAGAAAGTAVKEGEQAAAGAARSGVAEAGAAEGEAGKAARGKPSEQSTERKPSERGAQEGGGEGEGGEGGEGKSEEDIRREQNVKEVFEQGAQKSPEEEAEEAAFNPKELRFHEGGGKTQATEDEEEDDRAAAA